MPAKQYDILIEQGASFTMTVNALKVDGTIRDLTGYTGRMQVRETVSATDILVEASTINGLMTIDGPTGAVTVVIPGATTENYDWSNGVWDLEVENGIGTILRLIQGNAALSRQVTRQEEKYGYVGYP